MTIALSLAARFLKVSANRFFARHAVPPNARRRTISTVTTLTFTLEFIGDAPSCFTSNLRSPGQVRPLPLQTVQLPEPPHFEQTDLVNIPSLPPFPLHFEHLPVP